MKRISRKALLAMAAVIGMISITHFAEAQTTSTRTIVTRADISVANYEAVVFRVEVAPGATSGWHTHPGEEIAYVIDGEITLEVAANAPRKYGSGEAFVVPAGVVHNGTNHGTGTARLASVLVTEKGKPLATPASAPQK